MRCLETLLSLGLIVTATFAATSADWRSRTIYQVLTDRFARTDGSTSAACDTADQIYCGGSYQGIISQLDYIQGMGFDAVWVSPITQQIDRPSSFHGYWQNDINKLNSAFGTPADLLALSNALHARDMYLMIDVVVNHYAYDSSSPSDVDFSSFGSFNSEDYFHSYCTIDYSKYTNATQLDDCWTGSTDPPLPDLRTEDSKVADVWNSWVRDTVATYGIDGIRLDSAMMVNTGFWSAFHNAAGVYMVGEVYEYDSDWVCGFQNYLPGVLNYPLFQPLRAAFHNTSGSFEDLSSMVNSMKSECSDTSLLGTFSENHDQPRFAYGTPDMTLAQNIVAFTILADGIPIIYQGQEQHYNAAGTGSTGTDPYNREAMWLSDFATDVTLYEEIAKLNAARKNAIADDDAYLTYQNYAMETGLGWAAFRKGKMVSVLTNEGSDAGSSTAEFDSGYDASTSLTDILTCDTLTVDSSGKMSVPMGGGLPHIYYPTDSINDLCSGSNKVKRTPTLDRVLYNRWNRAALDDS